MSETAQSQPIHPSDTIRILVADDHTLFRRGLVSLLSEVNDFRVIGEATSGPQAVYMTQQSQPDILLMDVHMPGGDGVAAVKQLREMLPKIPVIMLTVSDSDADLFGAIHAGAKGYLLKNAEADELFSAIRRAAHGHAVLDVALTQRVFTRIEQNPTTGNDAPLSAREIEILQLIANGCTNREIASQLVLSENTIKTHVAHILEKLNSPSRNEAVALARANGWVTSG